MNSRWQIGIAMTLVMILFIACIVAMLKIDLTPAEKKSGPVVRQRNFGENINLSQHGIYDFDLISIGKAHMRKLRKGPFTIGAINELVLSDVSLALPEELWGDKADKADAAGAQNGQGNGGETGPKAMLARLGIDVGHIQMGRKMPRFSALVIKNFKVARIVGGTNAVPWFAAESGKAERAGLALDNGWSVESGVTNHWKSALLVVSPKIVLLY